MISITYSLECWKYLAIIVAVATVCVACSSSLAINQELVSETDRSVLRGWKRCTDIGCGRNFASAYSTFIFLQVDEKLQEEVPNVTTTPGLHWVEAYYSWGVGLIIGIGNYRNYGFEINLLPGYAYQIEKVPSGCIVPATKHWVSPKTLHVKVTSPSGESAVTDIRAMEYCTPNSRSTGSCKKDGDCSSGVCTPFGGATGYGLCGKLRQ